jgi:hypothetical protein
VNDFGSVTTLFLHVSASFRLHSRDVFEAEMLSRALIVETEPKLIPQAKHEAREIGQHPDTSDSRERPYLSGV